MPALLAKFPEVAKVFAKFGTDQAAAQAGLLEAVRDGLAVAFSHTFWVAAFLVLLTLVPAAFLPRKSEESHFLDDGVDEDDAQVPVLMH